MLSHIGLLLWLSYEAKTDRTQADKNKVTYGLLGKPKKPKRTKAGSKSEGPKKFPAAPFFEYFLQLVAEKKYSKNSAAGIFFGPSYSVMALDL